MQNEITAKRLRSFGLTVGSIFALLGLWPLVLSGEEPRRWMMALAACLVAPALLFPKSLVWPYKGWMALGHALGWLNTRIILGVVFYGLITPIGALRSWLGKDPMGRMLRPELDSYRVVRKPRPASHLRNQY